ncbi:MAG TPA: TIGR00730 family Rossman fold protein [Bryobacteraceae bacterium]|nr:TIGR00730 family Rossman fold protein [Bryobacteraceae bacterium]
MPNPTPPNNGRRPVAYLNEDFLNSPDARAIRILSEFLEPLAHFRRQKIRDTVVFFGSARLKDEGPLHEYYDDARTLARMLTEWAMQFTNNNYRFVVCSGGGPGIMEAANRGARDANGKTVGLNIGLPFEQLPNPYITPELSFEFHYFFMRKFWFAYLSKALVVFPGGFGTMDEMMELLTLTQTQKLAKQVTIVLYGSKYWKEIINFEALVKYGMISPEDLNLFQYADDPVTAFELLQAGLLAHALQPESPEMPAIAKSRNPQKPGGTA